MDSMGINYKISIVKVTNLAPAATALPATLGVQRVCGNFFNAQVSYLNLLCNGVV